MPHRKWEIDFKFRKSNDGGVFEDFSLADKSRRLHWWKSRDDKAIVGSADSEPMGGPTDTGSDPAMDPGDSFRFAFRDDDPQGTPDSVQMTIIYSRQDKIAGPNIASPVQLNGGAACCWYSRSCNNPSGDWWFSPYQTLAANSNEHGTKTFEFSLAIVVTYSDAAATVRHYGYDPTMNVRFP